MPSEFSSLRAAMDTPAESLFEAMSRKVHTPALTKYEPSQAMEGDRLYLLDDEGNPTEESVKISGWVGSSEIGRHMVYDEYGSSWQCKRYPEKDVIVFELSRPHFAWLELRTKEVKTILEVAEEYRQENEKLREQVERNESETMRLMREALIRTLDDRDKLIEILSRYGIKTADREVLKEIKGRVDEEKTTGTGLDCSS